MTRPTAHQRPVSARRPRFHIHVHIDGAYLQRVDTWMLRAAARATLLHQRAASPGGLSIVVASDRRLQQLNCSYRGYDYPTDVLSFVTPSAGPETGQLYFGDIAISYPRARAQAKASGHPAMAEIQLLVVHGVLHLLGHDHATRRGKAQMWAAQRQIIEQLNVQLGIAP